MATLPMFSETFSKEHKAALVLTARNSASWGFSWKRYQKLHLLPNNLAHNFVIKNISL